MWKDSISNIVVIFQHNILRIVGFYVRHLASVLQFLGCLGSHGSREKSSFNLCKFGMLSINMNQQSMKKCYATIHV